MTNIEIIWKNLQNQQDQGTAVLHLPVTIGSAPNNHLVLATPDAGVSRNHALLTYGRNGVQLRDLNSTNGIYINGKQITSTCLAPDTVLILGSYELRVNPLTRCTNSTCNKQVARDATTCPWCGYFLADARTRTHFWTS